MKNHAPFTVEHDGCAAMNPPEECLFLLNRYGQRVAAIEPEMPGAVALAEQMANHLNAFQVLLSGLQQIAHMSYSEQSADAIDAARETLANVNATFGIDVQERTSGH